MALSLSQTAALSILLKPGMSIAAMGYPDLIASETMLMDRFPDVVGFAYREDSEAICNRHGLKQRGIPDAHAFFKALGCKLDVYDIVQERGCEILCDLNEPFGDRAAWPYGVLPGYDIVLDVGTIEHCFNIGRAAMNMAGLVKHGGYIIHENPFLAGNHGFYGMNPTWYADFYATNGFELLECRLVTRDGRAANIPHTKRFTFTGEESNVFALAQRKNLKTMVYPMQSKYAKLMPAAVETGDKEKEHARAA